MSTPQCIDVPRHLDLRGRDREVWIRRALLGLLGVVVLLALLNVFGQRPQGRSAANDAAELQVYSPERVRGGLLFTSRFTVSARRTLHKPVLLLDPGWVEGMQVNSVNPQPAQESSRNGRIALQLEDIPAGQHAILFVEFQVDPTNVGRRAQDVTLEAAGMAPLTVHRTVTVFP